MVSAGDFRNGITFEEDGNVFQIVEFQHVKPGKGAAFVRTKIRNVISGSVVERTYNPYRQVPHRVYRAPRNDVFLSGRRPVLLHGQ